MNKLLFAAVLSVALLASPSSAITASSLTTIYVVPGVLDTPRVSTQISCSNGSGVIANLRFVFLTQAGTINQITVTLADGAATTMTAEEINAPLKIVANGASRGVVIIASTQSRVLCSAILFDPHVSSFGGSTLRMVRIGRLLPARIEPVPERDDHFAGRMIVKHMSVTEVAHQCARHLPDVRATALGCALGDARLCLVYLPHKASVGPHAYERLYRHEHAHCNGWRH